MKPLKLLCAAAAAVTMAFTAQAEKTAKAVLADGGATLRFVYDEADYGTKDTDWFSVADAEARDPSMSAPWAYEKFARVEFDPSFAQYKPNQCCNWFADAKELTEISGLRNLDVSNVANFSWMFANCRGLTTLDLSGFDMKNATHCYRMFAGCSSLATIYVSDAFVTTAVMSSDGMFSGCTSLVGGAGTAYDSTKTDKTYARIDKAGAPGYFTDIADVYKVKFVAGEGTGTMADLICARDKVYNLTKCAFTAPTGKAFKGWAGSNGRRYDDGVLVVNAAAEGGP